MWQNTVALLLYITAVFSAEVSDSDNSWGIEWAGCGPAVEHLIQHGINSHDLYRMLPSNGTAYCKGGPCCSPSVSEAILKRATLTLQQEVSLSTTAFLDVVRGAKDEFLERVDSALKDSEEKTLATFKQSYPRLANSVHQVFRRLFAGFLGDVRGTKQSSFSETLARFWKELFPIVYHSAVHAHLPPFTDSFKQCLRENCNHIKPWNVLPEILEDSLVKGLETVRLMVHGLTVATDVLSSVQDFRLPKECAEPVARMMFCGACHGSLEPPCQGLCLNVARGCLASLAEVQGSWDDLLGAFVRIEEYLRVVRLSRNLAHLPDRFSEAVMVAMISGPRIQNKVRRVCGQPRFADRSLNASLVSRSGDSSLSRVKPNTKGVHSESAKNLDSREYDLENVTRVLRKLESFRSWWGGIGDHICSKFSPFGVSSCWNGARAAPYRHSVVAPGVSAQKYNPEVMVPRPNPFVYNLNNKLREVKRMVTARLAWLPEPDSYRQYDSYSDGSGDGASVPSELERRSRGDDDDEDGGYGSGHSGDGPGDVDGRLGTNQKKDQAGQHGNTVAGSGMLYFSWHSYCALTLMWMCIIYSQYK